MGSPVRSALRASVTALDGPEPVEGIRGTWGDGLLVAIAGLTGLYSFFVWEHLASGDPLGAALAWVDGLSGVAAVLTFALLVLLRPGRTGRLALASFLCLAASANAVGHLAVGRDLSDTVLVVIVLMVIAAGITSSRAAALLVGVLWLGWLGATWGLRGDPEWGHSASHLGVATLSGLMLHVGLRMIMLRLIRAHRELDRLTRHDHLTGLANRRGFFSALERAAERADAGRGLVVVYCDVDGLKAVNDRHGHEAGDRLLVEVASRLAERYEHAECVARLGGDEFGVVLLLDRAGGTPAERAADLARSVRDDSGAGAWSLSVGAASGDEPQVLRSPQAGAGSTHELVGAVVGLADQRMYAAKRARAGDPVG